MLLRDHYYSKVKEGYGPPLPYCNSGLAKERRRGAHLPFIGR